MKYRYKLEGNGIHIRLYAINNEQLEEFRKDDDQVYSKLYAAQYDNGDPDCEYIGPSQGASIVICDENEHEVLNKELGDIENYGSPVPEGKEKDVKGGMCLVHILFEEGGYGEGEFELGEPFDPEELNIGASNIDEIINFDDFILEGEIYYGEEKLPFERELNTLVDRQLLGVARYNEYMQAEEWLIPLDYNQRWEDEEDAA